MRVCLTVAYEGTNYHGWQVQPNGITIESVLNQALSDCGDRGEPDGCGGAFYGECGGV